MQLLTFITAIREHYKKEKLLNKQKKIIGIFILQFNLFFLFWVVVQMLFSVLIIIILG